MTAATAKVKNGTITLPKKNFKRPGRKQGFLFFFKDTLIVKKMQKPLSNLSAVAKRISLPKMSKKEIEKEIQNYRKNKNK